MSDRERHQRRPGHSVPITREQMLARVVRFAELAPDPSAFPDLKDPQHERTVAYALSPNGTAGPAPLRAPHNFHLAFLTMRKGVRPVTHSHPYNEVFMPLDANFRFFWGDDSAEWVDLGPRDVISVPAGVFRTFENLDEHLAHVMAIFDTAGDPHTGIVVPPDIYARFYKDGWIPGDAPKQP